jgi:DNA-binding NarL/FixJ family response regulator
MITVLLVDDHASFRKSLEYMLEATNDIRVVATASNGVEAVAQAGTLSDVAVIDISMPVMRWDQATCQIRRCQYTQMMLSIFHNGMSAQEVGAAVLSKIRSASTC